MATGVSATQLYLKTFEFSNLRDRLGAYADLHFAVQKLALAVTPIYPPAFSTTEVLNVRNLGLKTVTIVRDEGQTICIQSHISSEMGDMCNLLFASLWVLSI